jgi:hypothetical protein
MIKFLKFDTGKTKALLVKSRAFKEFNSELVEFSVSTNPSARRTSSTYPLVSS